MRSPACALQLLTVEAHAAHEHVHLMITFDKQMASPHLDHAWYVHATHMPAEILFLIMVLSEGPSYTCACRSRFFGKYEQRPSHPGSARALVILAPVPRPVLRAITRVFTQPTCTYIRSCRDARALPMPHCSLIS